MVYFLIRNGTLIDGNGGNPVENAEILIKNHEIID